MVDRRSQAGGSRGDRMNTLETQRDEREEQLAGNGSGADEKRNTLAMSSLPHAAKTDEQKAPVKSIKKVHRGPVETAPGPRWMLPSAEVSHGSGRGRRWAQGMIWKAETSAFSPLSKPL